MRSSDPRRWKLMIRIAVAVGLVAAFLSVTFWLLPFWVWWGLCALPVLMGCAGWLALSAGWRYPQIAAGLVLIFIGIGLPVAVRLLSSPPPCAEQRVERAKAAKALHAAMDNHGLKSPVIDSAQRKWEATELALRVCQGEERLEVEQDMARLRSELERLRR